MPDSPLPLTPAGEAFLAALLRPDLTRAREVVREAADVGLPVDAIFEAVLTPALAEVGRRWAAGELSVAQEHMAAEVSQSLVAELTERIRRPTTSGRLAVVACSPKEEHCIGGQMLAGLLEAADWEVLYLGRSLPLEDLAALADREVPDAVALSTTLREHLPGARAALEALRGLDRPPFLLVGGAAHGRGDQAAELGVGGWARTAAEGVGLLDARVPGAGDALR